MNDDVRTAKERIELATMLELSALELVRGWTVQHAGDEMHRRGLWAGAIALADINRRLLGELRKKRRPIEEVPRCPHCAWPVPPRVVPKCVRCLRPREVRDEPGANPRLAEGA